MKLLAFKRSNTITLALFIANLFVANVFAEGRITMDWSPIREPAKALLELGKAGKADEYKAKIKDLKDQLDELLTKQPDSKLQTALNGLKKVRAEKDLGASTKMLEEWIPTLVDW